MTRGWRWAGALFMAGAMWTTVGCASKGSDESERGNPGMDDPNPQDERPGELPPPTNPPWGDGGVPDSGTDAGT